MAEESQAKGITFDEIGCIDMGDFLNISQAIIFDKKEGALFFTYKFRDEPVDFQFVGCEGGKYFFEARANRFSVDEKLLEKRNPGYVFNGFLWIQPKKVSVENYGVGGRIFCWVSEDMKDLSSLVLGDAKTETELDARLELIKKGYKNQAINERKSEERARQDEFRNGEFNAHWKERHGYL